MSIFAIRQIISHMSSVKYGEKMEAIQWATIKKLKRNIDEMCIRDRSKTGSHISCETPSIVTEVYTMKPVMGS